MKAGTTTQTLAWRVTVRSSVRGGGWLPGIGNGASSGVVGSFRRAIGIGKTVPKSLLQLAVLRILGPGARNERHVGPGYERRQVELLWSRSASRDGPCPPYEWLGSHIEWELSSRRARRVTSATFGTSKRPAGGPALAGLVATTMGLSPCSGRTGLGTAPPCAAGGPREVAGRGFSLEGAATIYKGGRGEGMNRRKPWHRDRAWRVLGRLQAVAWPRSDHHACSIGGLEQDDPIPLSMGTYLFRSLSIQRLRR